MGSTGQQCWTVVRNTPDIKGNAALWAVVSLVSLVKGGRHRTNGGEVSPLVTTG